MENEVTKVWFEDEKIFIETNTGEKGNHPLSWFPKLLNATEEQRNLFKLSPFGIHWKEIDEDLSFEGFFKYSKNKEMV